jgi:hypothetical protein
VIGKINYDDKVSLTSSPLPRANKCTADDLNEIKQVVNENADEFEEEIGRINGTVLYESENGTTGNVTLSDSAANYDYISIEGRRTSHAYPSQKFYKPNGKTITLSSTYALNNDIYLYTKVINISGTQITVLSSKLGYFNSSSMAVVSDTDNYITRVVGYKE